MSEILQPYWAIMIALYRDAALLGPALVGGGLLYWKIYLLVVWLALCLLLPSLDSGCHLFRVLGGP